MHLQKLKNNNKKWLLKSAHHQVRLDLGVTSQVRLLRLVLRYTEFSFENPHTVDFKYPSNKHKFQNSFLKKLYKSLF